MVQVESLCDSPERQNVTLHYLHYITLRVLTALLVYSEFVNSISAPSSIKGVILVVNM